MQYQNGDFMIIIIALFARAAALIQPIRNA
jgi:hypothetical protein